MARFAASATVSIAIGSLQEHRGQALKTLPADGARGLLVAEVHVGKLPLPLAHRTLLFWFSLEDCYWHGVISFGCQIFNTGLTHHLGDTRSACQAGFFDLHFGHQTIRSV
ncbi:hypothetical protein [Caudoviricetes sp.]|nr:hypothetical protein [Caudoviricetes sp.]